MWTHATLSPDALVAFLIVWGLTVRLSISVAMREYRKRRRHE